MRSKANIAGHPLHPMLIAFPIAFLSGAFGFDAAAAFFRNRGLAKTGDHLRSLGILSGFVAAIPGIIDYYTVIPPKSIGQDDAKRHAWTNSAAMTFFGLAAWVKHRKQETNGVVVGLEAIGAALLTYGGWLGGEVAYVDQIGVERNYAHAGERQEETVTPEQGQAVVAEAGDLEVDQMKLLHVNGRRIVLVRNADGYSAFDDRCPHQGGSLADGAAVCGTVQCPWHGSQFDTESGALKKGPAAQGVRNYRVDSRGGKILLHLRESSAKIRA